VSEWGTTPPEVMCSESLDETDETDETDERDKISHSESDPDPDMKICKFKYYGIHINFIFQFF
jgi:hypothetical protein